MRDGEPREDALIQAEFTPVVIHAASPSPIGIVHLVRSPCCLLLRRVYARSTVWRDHDTFP